MIHISLSITLLTLIAAMHLLAKTRKEDLGAFFKWVSYVVIAACMLMFVAEAIHGMCGRGCYGRANCGPEMGMHKGMGGHQKKCCGEMKGGHGDRMGCDHHGMKGHDGKVGTHEEEDYDDHEHADSMSHAH